MGSFTSGTVHVILMDFLQRFEVGTDEMSLLGQSLRLEVDPIVFSYVGLSLLVLTQTWPCRTSLRLAGIQSSWLTHLVSSLLRRLYLLSIEF